jgi:hypothetical protein
MYPVGIVVERVGNTNPSGFFGGTWVLIGVTGTIFGFAINQLGVQYIFSGNNVSVNITCLNNSYGNLNVSYEFSEYGISIQPVEGLNNEMIPMNFMLYNPPDKYLVTQNDLSGRIFKNSATKITVDSNNGNSTKNDYVLSFTTIITDLSKAATQIGNTCVTKWKRTA